MENSTMSGKTRVIKSLCIITLLALPTIAFSIYFVSLLFNSLYLSILNLEDWLKYLLLGLFCMCLLPFPPPSKKRVKFLQKTILSYFRKFLRQKQSQNWVIQNNFDINSIHDHDLEELVSGLNQASLYKPEYSKNYSSTHTTNYNASQNRVASGKKLLSGFFLMSKSFFAHSTRLLHKFFEVCKSTFLKFEGVAIDFLNIKSLFHIFRVELS
jgi:hypothetical protein